MGKPCREYHEAYPLNGTDLFKPIVGAVRGYALGLGYIIAVTGCDITIAADNTPFGYPESRAGGGPDPASICPLYAFQDRPGSSCSSPGKADAS